MRTLATLAASAILLALPALASASPTYPAEIVTDLAITCQPATPQCTVCHATNQGGGKPVTKFGNAMVGAGLVPNDPASLNTALQKLTTDKTGAAGSGPSYIDDLKACNDPNAGTVGVGYGIYCSAAPRARDTGAPALALMTVALLLGVARRRRSAIERGGTRRPAPPK